MTDTVTLEQASFSTVDEPDRSIPIMFNPTSLQYSITNTLSEKGPHKKQYVAQSTAKLTVDLIYDTTEDGTDVRSLTSQVAKLMEPKNGGSRGRNVPSIVVFEWGTFRFKGMVESYKETIDFFAPAGVPLRATVNLTLAQQEKVFEADQDARAAPDPQPVVPLQAQGEDTTDIATRGGNPRAGRGIARTNGLESMRFPSGAALAVSGSVSLGGPVAFASGSAGAGFAIGDGRPSVSAAATLGPMASARVSASAGAFAGLRTIVDGARPATRLDLNRLFRRSESAILPTDRDASFAVDGRAKLAGSSSLRADVGVTASLRAAIQFDE